jgi:hypothetical protein
MEKLFETLSLLNNSGIQQSLLPLKLIFGLVAVLFIVFSVFVLVRSAWVKFLFLFDYTEFFTFRPYGLRRVVKKWQKIQQRLETANEGEYKLAVIEIDGMLSDILLRMGFKGETLGDRLEIVTSAIIPNLQDLIQAHQVRNNVVHDPDYKLTLQEAQKTLEIYQVAFTNLDLI